jgi:hypothetical protein
MSSQYSALAGKIRDKFPGQYDDLSDDDLGKKVIAKHPEYQDLVQSIPGEVPERQTLAPLPKPPGVLGRPAMPGVASKYAGPQSVALSSEQRSSRNVPGDVAKIIAPTMLTAVAPEAMLPGAVASVIGRGAGALAGASYGGKKAAELGLPRWSGQAVGGLTGLFAPEVIGRLSGPLISRIATVLGKSVPEVATVITEDTIAQRVGRDVVERAARGQPLTQDEEEMLLQQVQKHYTPEAGVESSARKAGKVYAGRGTSLRPTNEQISVAEAMKPKITYKVDKLGVKWAHSPASPNPVSIPRGIPEAEVEEYAAKKLAEQAKLDKVARKTSSTRPTADF